MSPGKVFTRYAVTTIAILFLGSASFAQSGNPAWIDDLNLQLSLEYQCQVVDYEALHEGKLGGQNTYTATVICEDGRKYDANRVGEEDDFSIRICEVIRC